MAETPQAVIEEAVERIVAIAEPVKVILFGSYARGDGNDDSDLDFLVIVPKPVDKYAEMIRLSRALASLRFPADLLVYSVDDVKERGHLQGTAPGPTHLNEESGSGWVG